MTKESLRKVEYFEMSTEEYRKLSPFEKTKAVAQKEVKHGWFHGWATDTHLLSEKDSGDLPQLVYATHAIIEQTDGSIVKIKPENIRFIG